MKKRQGEFRLIGLLMSLLLLVFFGIGILYMSRTAAGTAALMIGRKPVVAVDAGHGGRDPGKIAADGTLEKDINLAIAGRLAAYLEQSDVEVIRLRETDTGLEKAGADNRKLSDLKNRCSRIQEAEPDLAISIHQNSCQEESVAGGQVFYYTGSEQGKQLAKKIQRRLNAVSEAGKPRQVKPDGSYYLLLHTGCPIVIAECGFLSNPEETKRLQTDEYQDRLAFQIHMGIMEYLNSR